MSEPAELPGALLAEALKLSTSARARLAAELIASVDGEPDADAEAAWVTEIDRRAQRVRAGAPKGDDWRLVRARIDGRLRVSQALVALAGSAPA